MIIPISVYRLQLSSEMTIKKAEKILPYLKALGIEAIYCSPYFQAYSTHGYDITDPNRFNSLLGTPKEFQDFFRAVKKHGMMHICDVVPNHMGIKGGQNQWWQDVLKNGPYSIFAPFFDINWNPEKRELQDRVLLPILDQSYGEVLNSHAISLSLKDGYFSAQYADYPLPIATHTYPMILEVGIEELQRTLSKDHPDLKEYMQLIEHFRQSFAATQERANQEIEGQRRLIELLNKSASLRDHIDKILSLFNGKHTKAISFDLFDKLLEKQFYRISYWRVAGHEINYRRFFNLSELISIKMEDDPVFEAHHAFLFQLISEGHIDGIRIDHPDGLYDPIQYFQKLRQRFSLLTIAEKILERKEKLPQEWEVDGTVGYEYLNVLNGLFVKRENEKIMGQIYENYTGDSLNFEDALYKAKKYFAEYEMASDVEALGLQLDRLSENSPEYRDLTRHDLTVAFAEVIAFFPVYRSYVRMQGAVSKRDAHLIKIAIQKAKAKRTDLDISIFDFLEKLLLVKWNKRRKGEEAYRDCVLRFQQLTAPIMAKGLEDTVCYTYNRLLSLNEVGGDPQHFGYSVGDFHAQNKEKQEFWPKGFLTTSTHDSKRSEDVRMRLNVLSEIPQQWELEVKKWALVNSKYKKGAPSLNTEYYIYQTLLGVWPRNRLRSSQHSALCERVWQMILKAMREAKQETSWRTPNHDYEEATREFVFAILSSRTFMRLFTQFLALIDRYGAWNSLSQVVLKGGSPGIYEIYQGNELLIYHLSDPDNRTPVNFNHYQKELRAVQNISLEELFTQHDLSRFKMALQTCILHHRLQHKSLFLEGNYIPLTLRGSKKDHAVAYMRQKDNSMAIIVAARFYTSLASAEWDIPIGKHIWGNTELILPEGEYPLMTDLFTKNLIQPSQTLPLTKLFTLFPFCLLYV
jgi:(1->4)-alpha-D-glucan 1-alpha-D-glucosylmutase